MVKSAFNLNLIVIAFFVVSAYIFNIMFFAIIAFVFMVLLPACSRKH
ncbi:hypothetical protein Phi14:2_gp128 [Cellulophaga phage phi14:2]|uniref:Transmembrane protein n=1 Tax=Cellulophaga phage phi14:2 TaxID=1327990 RepID=S0A0W6_9CAUD|nr:hypothetical protein Phi14:2_gp128 [Cellulophaga phage phi14:2]